jgi:hypothetical protein
VLFGCTFYNRTFGSQRQQNKRFLERFGPHDEPFNEPIAVPQGPPRRGRPISYVLTEVRKQKRQSRMSSFLFVYCSVGNVIAMGTQGPQLLDKALLNKDSVANDAISKNAVCSL